MKTLFEGTSRGVLRFFMERWAASASNSGERHKVRHWTQSASESQVFAFGKALSKHFCFFIKLDPWMTNCGHAKDDNLVSVPSPGVTAGLF